MKVLGMLSGTSVDAIDVAIAEFREGGDETEFRLLWHGEYPWNPDLRSRILAVLPPAVSDAGQWCRLDTETGQAFAGAARWAIDAAGPVDLIASHGQTLYHWVEEGEVRGSLQIGNPAWIHAATGLPVIADFRTADIAAGGHGAPLASTLDELWLGDSPTAALNLGGIANVTIVGHPDGVLTGDTGPASCLLDAAASRHHGLAADVDGRLALAGTVDEEALAILLADPYYSQPLPRSSGREYFHADYVDERLAGRELVGPDLFATLTELTARTVAAVVNAVGVRRVVASGGGMNNPALVQRLRANLQVPLISSAELGMPADAKEAYLFALLGYLSSIGAPGVVRGRDGKTATGATHAAVLGTRTLPSSSSHPAPVRKIRLLNQEEE